MRIDYSSILGLTFFSLFIGCVSSPKPDKEKNYEKEYRASFDEVWRASQQAVINYPLKLNNMEQGQIQTTTLRKGVQFKPAHEAQSHAGGHRYDLTLKIIKISPKTTKVLVQKNVQIYRDFISEPEEATSDGLEESIILYRIAREIDVDRALVRQMKKTKATSKN